MCGGNVFAALFRKNPNILLEFSALWLRGNNSNLCVSWLSFLDSVLVLSKVQKLRSEMFLKACVFNHSLWWLLLCFSNLGLNPFSSTCTKRCCKVIVPPGSQTRTRVATRTLSTRHHSNYKCGLWGWRRCGRDTTRYVHKKTPPDLPQ